MIKKLLEVDYAGIEARIMAYGMEELQNENKRLREQVETLKAALEPLVSACEADFGGNEPTEGDWEGWEDDEAVGGGAESEMALTFGVIRRARKALERSNG